MGNILENLTAAIESLEANVKSGVEVMRQQKHEVQQMQEAIRMNNLAMRYVRDNDCLILSAPNIIIGNVDSTGRLYSGGSRVVIRGNNISSEATGENGDGVIRQRATTIENIAVDPGMDGLENVVFPNSRIVNHARAVTLQSDDEMGTFASEATTALGVNIVSDNAINIAALAPNQNRKDDIDKRIMECQKTSDTYADAAAKYKRNLTDCIEKLGTLITSQDDLNGSDDLVATNFEELYGEQHERFKELERLLYTFASGYISCLSMQAEAERSISSLQANRTRLEKNTTDFDTSGTASSISLRAESVSVCSTDGDGTIRSNDGAGLFVNAPHVRLEAHDKDGALIEDSSIELNAQDIDVSTASVIYDSDEQDSAQIPAIGDVTITSKNVTIQAVDKEFTNSVTNEKALTSGGSFAVRAETMTLKATDTEGNAAGSLCINTQNTEINAADTLHVMAEKTLIGSSEKAKLIQLAADNIAVIAKTTAEMQQDGNAVVTLSAGKMTAGASAVEIDGDTTIKGCADIKGEAKAPILTADTVTAKAEFSSPTISDAQGSGSAAAATAPSPHLTEEENVSSTSNS